MTKLFWLFALGGLGTLARYALAVWLPRWYRGELPLGTLVANLVGCLLFGFLWTLAEERRWMSSDMRILLLTGFMGAFTTFSTYAFDTAQMLRVGDWGLAAFNLLANNGLGIAGVILGIAVAKWL